MECDLRFWNWENAEELFCNNVALASTLRAQQDRNKKCIHAKRKKKIYTAQVWNGSDFNDDKKFSTNIRIRHCFEKGRMIFEKIITFSNEVCDAVVDVYTIAVYNCIVLSKVRFSNRSERGVE